MTDANDMVTRLKRIEGQIRGLQRMIEEERDCAAFIQQLSAARKALEKVGVLAITHRMTECFGIARPGTAFDESALAETVRLFEQIS